MKKLLGLFISFIFSFSMYAQSAKSVGLTDSDVKNWSKNCVSIQKEFEKIGIDVEEELSVSDSEKNIVEKVLVKYGISNPNCIEKISVILQCAGVLKTESQMDEKAKSLMKMMNLDPFAEIKKNINPKDYNIVLSNSKAVLNALEDLNNYNSEAVASNTDEEDYSDYLNSISDYSLSYSDYESKDDIQEKEILKKYDTKKKFEVIKEGDGIQWIIIKPSEITFKNSIEAEIYARNYEGVKGDWSFCGSCGYLGEINNKSKKPFYTWVDGGVGCYTKFPIDFDTCAPDKIIEDKDVTPEIAKKTVLQMYK